VERSLFNVIVLCGQIQASYSDLNYFLWNPFPKLKFGLIPICDSVSFRFVIGRFGLVPNKENNSVSFRFCPKWDSVTFWGPTKVRSHSDLAQNWIRSHSDWSFGLSHSV
jgi:hypothetical protein